MFYTQRGEDLLVSMALSTHADKYCKNSYMLLHHVLDLNDLMS